MHEFSIAEALLDLAEQHLPKGSVLRSIDVEAGPKRGVDPDAMELAWKALSEERSHKGVKLNLTLLPWNLKCPGCNRQFTAADLFAKCECGNEMSTPIGGDELRLLSIEIDETPTPA